MYAGTQPGSMHYACSWRLKSSDIKCIIYYCHTCTTFLFSTIIPNGTNFACTQWTYDSFKDTTVDEISNDISVSYGKTLNIYLA